MYVLPELIWRKAAAPHLWLMDCSPEHQTVISSSRMGQASQQDKVVLVVDDDEALRASLEFILGIEGYAVRTYAHGRALLDDGDLPADGCLIVDQRLPDMEGLHLIDSLRRREVRLPAILITSNPTSALRVRAQLAAVSLVEKPFVTGTLFQHITLALK